MSKLELILASKQVKTQHNQPDSGPDAQGRKRELTCTETAAISNYLDYKGKPWLDIAEDAGIELPKTSYFKPPGLRTMQSAKKRRSSHEHKLTTRLD